MSASTDFQAEVCDRVFDTDYCYWPPNLGSSLWPGKQKAIYGISASRFSECKEIQNCSIGKKKSCWPSFGMQGACFIRNFWLKDQRWILTGIVLPYNHSSNASTESGRKETHFFCIMTTQGHIAVHKLRMPWQTWNSQWFHTLLTVELWHRQTFGCSQNWRSSQPETFFMDGINKNW